jgi:hypothetical protein
MALAMSAGIDATIYGGLDRHPRLCCRQHDYGARLFHSFFCPFWRALTIFGKNLEAESELLRPGFGKGLHFG